MGENVSTRLSTDEAQALSLRHFGIRGTVSNLGGERTQNIRIWTDEGKSFTLKVSDPDEAVECVELENAALRHIEAVAPQVCAPRVVPTLNGEDTVLLERDDNRYLRLLTYIEGTPFSLSKDPPKVLAQAIGKGLAQLDAALLSFHDPFSISRDLLWDIKKIERTKSFIPLVNRDRRSLVEEMFQRFEENVEQHWAHLPTQSVHSDMNGQNILIDGENLAGFIDFGDLVYGPRLVDLAGATLLQVCRNSSDWEKASEVVRAYHQVSQLDEIEIKILPDVMIARCLINLCVTEFLAELDPGNRQYIMKNNDASWKRLTQLSFLKQHPFLNIL